MFGLELFYDGCFGLVGDSLVVLVMVGPIGRNWISARHKFIVEHTDVLGLHFHEVVFEENVFFGFFEVQQLAHQFLIFFPLSSLGLALDILFD
jgi:hypothetical protein